MGVAVGVISAEADARQQFGDPVLPVALRQNVGKDDPRLAHDLGHGHARVQGRERVLEDDLHAAAATAHVACRKLKNVLTVQ